MRDPRSAASTLRRWGKGEGHQCQLGGSSTLRDRLELPRQANRAFPPEGGLLDHVSQPRDATASGILEH